MLRTVAPTDLPAWIGEAEVTGLRAFDRAWDVRLTHGKVTVRAAA
jgi:hypothetical protein